MMKPYFLTLASFFGSFLLLAQGPIHDEIRVTFDTPVNVANHTLEPGEYTIRQVPSANNPRILEFLSEDGSTLEVTAAAIATLDNLASHATSVQLESEGGSRYIHRIWLAGKNYGYEFLPSEGATLAQAQPRSLQMTATYRPAERPQEVAQAAPPPAQPEPPARPEPAPAPAPEPQREPEREIAQAQPPAVEEPPLAPATPDMPETAAGWPLAVFGGMALTGAGLLLRRRAR